MRYGDEGQSDGGYRERRGRFGGNRNGGGGMRGGGVGGGGFSPVKVGEELDVKIEAVGEKGDGIAKKNGFVIFIPGVHEGDQVRIRITKVFRKMAFAEVIGEAQGPTGGAAPEAAPEAAESEGEESESEEEETTEDETEDTEEF